MGVLGPGRTASVVALDLVGGRVRAWWWRPVRTCGRNSMGGALAGALSWWQYQLGGLHAVVSSAVPMAGPTLWWHWLRLMLWLQAGTCIPDWRSSLL